VLSQSRIALPGLGLSLALVATGGCASLNDAFGPQDSDREVSGGRVAPADCTPRAAPAYALGGTVLTPDGPVRGYVVVAGELIVGVVTTAAQAPEGATVIETGGIISPGFIDLHNHVNYNFLPFWDSGRQWSNRFEWTADQGYVDTVKTPFDAVKAARHQCQGLKYGEFRALVGGTTTIQGSSDSACSRAWVRNVEHTNFCEDHIGQHGGALSYLEPEEVTSLIASFDDHSIRTFFMHLAEGVDELSRHEFDELRTLGLVRSEVVLTHGTALTSVEFEEMARAGMKLTWSPQSNLALYGRTTDIPAALTAGVMISIAPDWSPSGTANLLAELKVADQLDRDEYGDVITDEAMFQMATANPADMANMQTKIGRIAPGLYADLVVLRGDVEHPYRAIVDAAPADVLATFVSGEILYGERRLLDALGRQGQYETLPADVACGEERGLVARASDPALAGGQETLQTIVTTLETDTGESVIPLFDCGEESAAAGE
jgi:cytosine/adenosine deaminase-related metal-dependent hydrolase